MVVRDRRQGNAPADRVHRSFRESWRTYLCSEPREIGIVRFEGRFINSAESNRRALDLPVPYGECRFEFIAVRGDGPVGRLHPILAASGVPRSSSGCQDWLFFGASTPGTARRLWKSRCAAASTTAGPGGRRQRLAARGCEFAARPVNVLLAMADFTNIIEFFVELLWEGSWARFQSTCREAVARVDVVHDYGRY